MGSLVPPTHTHTRSDKERNNNTSGGTKPAEAAAAQRVFGDYSASEKKAFTMVDAFCATWKLVDSENFDEYMKALGEWWHFLLLYTLFVMEKSRKTTSLIPLF